MARQAARDRLQRAVVGDAVLADLQHHRRAGRLGPGHDRLGVLDADHVERADARGPPRRAGPTISPIPASGISRPPPARGCTRDHRAPAAWRSPPRLNSPATGAAAGGGAERDRVPQPLRPRAGPGPARAPGPRPTASPAPVGFPATTAGGTACQLPSPVTASSPSGAQRDHDRRRPGRPQLPRRPPPRPARSGAAAGQRPPGDRLQLGQVRLDDRRARGRAAPQRRPRARPAPPAPRRPPPSRSARRSCRRPGPAAGSRTGPRPRTRPGRSSYRTRNSAYSSAPTCGPGSLNSGRVAGPACPRR